MNGPTVSEVVSNSLRGSVLACVSGILLSVIVSCIARIMASQFQPLVGYLCISLQGRIQELGKGGRGAQFEAPPRGGCGRGRGGYRISDKGGGGGGPFTADSTSGGGGGRGVCPPVANRGTVLCGYNRTRYAKYTHEYLMSRPKGGGHVPLVPPPPPPPRSAPGLLHQMCHVPKRGSFLYLPVSYPGILQSMM